MTKKTRKSHNNAILNIRIPEPILAQLTTISDAQYKSVSTVVRDLIVQHIQQNQVFLLQQNPALPQQRRPLTSKEIRDMNEQQLREPPLARPQSPSQQNQLSDQQYADDWL